MFSKLLIALDHQHSFSDDNFAIVIYISISLALLSDYLHINNEKKL